MTSPILNVLVIEDSEDDAFLVIRELRNNEFNIAWQRVETADALRRALETSAWDIILSDYTLPKLNAPAALEIVKRSQLDIPFIVIAGSIGERLAVDMMKAGAHDYVMKDCLTRLPEAIRRELREADVRKIRKQAEASLQISQQRYATLASTVPVGIFRHDSTGDCVYVNDQACKISGLSRQATLSGRWSEALHPDDRALVEAAWEDAVQNHRSYQFEYRFQHADRTVRWAYIQAVPERDIHGHVVGYVGTITDISDRKQTELALQSLVQGTAATTGQDFFPALVKHITKALGIASAFVAENVGDEINILAFWSHDSLQPTLTYPLSNTPCEVILRDSHYYCSQSIQEEFPDHRFLETWQAESFLGIALKDTRGNIIGALCVFDQGQIVNSERAENLLQIFAARAAAELERQKAQTALTNLNKELEAKVVERTAKLQAQQQELTRKNLDLQVANQQAKAANKVKSRFLAHMSHELRSPLNAILGFAQLIECSPSLPEKQQNYATLIYKSGQHLLNMINDVLDMSKLEAGQSILNPSDFSLLALFSELYELFQIRVAEKNLEFVFERASDLPNNIRTDAGKLRQVLINLLDNAIKFTDKGKITLRARVIQTETDNNVDQPQATSEDKMVSLHFEVEDTGSGIAPHELEQAFAPFVQTKTGQDSHQGSGLGLSISQQFVKLMGGDISLNSQVVNNSVNEQPHNHLNHPHGTLVSFHIQAIQSAAAPSIPATPKQQSLALAPEQTHYRLLIVDDDLSNRQLLLRLLQPLGFNLKEAINGQEAIDIWHSWQPDLIWMDLNMPLMDGYQATQRIRENTYNNYRSDVSQTISVQSVESPDRLHKNKQPSIIAVSANNSPDNQLKAQEAGCDGFIAKPFKKADIFSILHQLLGVKYS